MNQRFVIKLLVTSILLGFCSIGAAFAQTIKGKVTDSANQPLAGAAVFFKGTTTGVTTDAKGNYSITARGGAKVLVFSFVGMKELEVPINNRAVINVSLEDDSNFLDEAVAIGYSTVQRRDLLGSVASVNNKEIIQVPVLNFTEALAGKMAGVDVRVAEGDPDSPVDIKVRGTGSITQDSSPLYIVDGFPVNSISDISPSEIKTIDVLKDAKGGLRQVGIGPMAFAGDVKVRGKRLYVAEAMDGLGVYEIGCKGALKEVARFKDFRKDGPLAHCLWVYVPSDDWVVASTRDMGNYYISMKDFPQLRFEAKIGDNPGWDKYASISADSQGMYPAMRPYLGICWVNLNKTPLEESVQKIKDARFTLYDGLCPYKNDSFLSVSRGKLFIYSAAQSGQEVEPIVAGDDDFRGLPAWDGGKRLSLTCRIRREIRLVDLTQEQEPRLLWMERTEGFPETSIFWKGKLAVPCGYQGLLLEK